MSFVRSLARGAALCVLASAAAACAATPRYPITEGQPLGPGGITQIRPQYATSEAVPAPAAAASPITVAQAAPALSRPTAPATPMATPPATTAAAAVSEKPLAPPPAPAPEPVPVPVPPPHEVIVGPGETIYDVAARQHSPVRGIIDLNHLTAPYALHAGQKLTVATPAVYEVQSGDTLFGIARRFMTDPRTLSNINDLTLQSHLRVGQRLALPEGARDKGPDAASPPHVATAEAGDVPATTGPATSAWRPAPKPSTASEQEASTGSSTVASQPVRGKKPVRTTADAMAAAESSTTASPLGTPLPTASNEDAEAVAAGRGKFTWPVRGAVIASFGPKATGQRNDGINIDAAMSAPVASAADGEVVYAGSSIPGFGNLVLVKHADGWVTAYAHLSKFAVRIRDAVSQGQTIGYVGQTGGVDQPQLHFELRYAPTPKDKARPIDPALLLPR